MAASGEVASYRWRRPYNGTTWKSVSWPGYDTDTLSRTMIESYDGRWFRYAVTFADGEQIASAAAQLTLKALSLDFFSSVNAPEAIAAIIGPWPCKRLIHDGFAGEIPHPE